MRFFGAIGGSWKLVGRSYDPQRGYSTTYVCTGTEQQINALEAAAKAEGIRYRTDYSGKLPSITAEFDDARDGTDSDAQLQSVWSLARNQEQKDVWQHPRVLAITDAWTATQLADFRKEIEQSFSQDVTTELALLWSQNEDLWRLAAHLYNNQLTYESRKYVLRNRSTYPGAYQFVPDYGNENKLISSAALAAAQPTIPFSLPVGKYWLTIGYEIDQTVDGRIEVVREWWETEYDAWLYDVIA